MEHLKSTFTFGTNLKIQTPPALLSKSPHFELWTFCQIPVLGLELGVDFTLAWDHNDNNNNKNPLLNSLKGTVLGDKGKGIRP